MAKLQIFVLVVALSQVYGNVVIHTYPAAIAPEVRPELIPVVPELRPEIIEPEFTPGLRPEVEALPEAIPLPTLPEATPPCVQSIRAILEAILAKLPTIEVPRPLPVEPSLPEPEVEEEEEPLPDAHELPQLPVFETPCSACFEHISSLLNTAEKALAVRRLLRM